MHVVYLLQASASVSNECRPIFQRKREREKERYTKVESRREKERKKTKIRLWRNKPVREGKKSSRFIAHGSLGTRALCFALAKGGFFKARTKIKRTESHERTPRGKDILYLKAASASRPFIIRGLVDRGPKYFTGENWRLKLRTPIISSDWPNPRGTDAELEMARHEAFARVWA
ncbi:hypothetical protein EVAR_16270_1 [Eumeta japonica]|uniref:Uncharacterized protein n=1 Tax=Eumeta variegata TaxID=151549 RepID=A0A4C1U623_EUMVA|nr:hypothetical protein EVAR_16270_1 [Eumeta japonica]